jgi:hypothetical protein
MTASGNALRESLSSEMKHEVAALPQRAARNAMRAQQDIAATTKALAMPTAEDESAARRASYVPTSKVWGRTWLVNSDGPCTSIIDLTSTGTAEFTDSSEDK